MSEGISGQVLGAATASVVLPATASAITGIKYFYCLIGFAIILVAYNIIIKVVSKLIK